MNKNIFWIAPILVMAIGALPMPYGYYSLSRLVVCSCSIYFAHKSYVKNQSTLMWAFGFLAVLYNPIIPIHLYQKEIWIVVNIFTSALFFLKKDVVIKEESE